MDQTLMIFFRGVQVFWDGQITYSVYEKGFEIAEFQQKSFNNPHTAAHIMINWVLANRNEKENASE